MRLFLTIHLVLMIYSAVHSQEYLIPTSQDSLVSQLAEPNTPYSQEFYRFARNEIFARHGYVFEDSCLQKFFTHRTWYKKGIAGKLDLNEIEKENIAFLKAKEDGISQSYSKVLYKYSFNDMPLAYIAKRPPRKGTWASRDGVLWGDGDFLLLPMEYKWVLYCESLPPEFFYHCASSVRRNASDYKRHLVEERISFVDIDKDFVNNLGIEIQYTVDGVSDDPEIVILGLDEERKLRDYFTVPSTRYETKKLNEHLMLVSATTRFDLHATSFHRRELLFNTKSKKGEWLSKSFIKCGHAFPAKKKIPVYYNLNSAILNPEHAIIDSIYVGDEVTFVQFYTREGSNIRRGDMPIAVEIATRNQVTGWIPYSFINREYFDRFSFAD